jgi:hypothetical protein
MIRYPGLSPIFAGSITENPEETMRTTLLAAVLGFGLAIAGATPSLAQAGDKIKGKTCNELFRSCFRICALHKGEPAYQGCEADCNNGQRSCRSTGIWKSKNATVTAEPQRAKEKRRRKK